MLGTAAFPLSLLHTSNRTGVAVCGAACNEMTPWRDGTSHIALQPLELLEKLAALTPRPYVNLIVYQGVLASNAKWRREVVDFGRPQVEKASSASTPKNVIDSHNRTSAELMQRGLDIDVLECPDCGGRLRFVAAVLLSSAVRGILSRWTSLGANACSTWDTEPRRA